MLTVLLDWIFILATNFCLGYGFCALQKKVTGYDIKRMDSVLMTGFVVSAVYAQFFSMVYKVSAVAVCVLSVLCLGIVAMQAKNMAAFLKKSFQETSLIRKGVIALLFVLWIYFTCQGYMHYDTDLYHAQSIRWIEEYGVVKGLANVYNRLAYNSSLFAVTALYSFKFMLGQSLHTINGYVAFLLSLAMLDLGKSFRSRKLMLSDFAAMAGIYYLTLIVDEVVSPASDYISMCMIFYIVLKWLKQLETKEKSIVPFAMLCVAVVFAMSVKLTAGLILILLIYPAAVLLQEKRWKEIGFYLLSGILVAAPWMARTVIISGWLLYPYTSLDLFPVAWKLPAWEVELDAAEIKTWGRALYSAALTDVPVTQWFPNWFKTTLSTMEKLLILGDFVAIVGTFFIGLYSVIRKKKENAQYLLVMAAVLASFLFWQMSAPLIRYGYAYVLLGVSLFAGFVLKQIKMDFWVGLILVVYGVYKFYGVARYGVSGLANDFLVWQQDYNQYELEQYETKGITFYAPPENSDLLGYDKFPATAKKVNNIKLLGETMADGFRRK